MRIPLLFSVVFHLAIFLFALFGIPSSSDDVAMDYRVIDVEVVSVTETPEPQPIPKPDPPAPKKTKAPPPPPPAKPEPPKQTAALPPEPTPEPEPAPAPKPAEAPPKPKVEVKAEAKPAPPRVAPRPKVRPKPDFNTMMLKTVQKLKEQPREEQPEKKESFDDRMAALMKRRTLSPREQVQQAPLGENLSISEIDAIRRQIERCWLVPTTIGAKDVDKMKVEIGMKLNPDGSLRSARIVDQFRFETSPSYRAVAETALRAVRNPRCNKFDLPLAKYEIWKDMIVMFDPSEMVGR